MTPHRLGPAALPSGSPLLLREPDHRYLNHAAFGLRPWEAFALLTQENLQGDQWLLAGPTCRWAIQIQPELSVDHVPTSSEARLVPTLPDGRLSLLGRWPVRPSVPPGVLVLPWYLAQIAPLIGTPLPYPAEPAGWQAGPPNQPGAYWVQRIGTDTPALLVVEAIEGVLTCPTLPELSDVAHRHRITPPPFLAPQEAAS